jgi:hypothetical protein
MHRMTLDPIQLQRENKQLRDQLAQRDILLKALHEKLQLALAKKVWRVQRKNLC